MNIVEHRGLHGVLSLFPTPDTIGAQLLDRIPVYPGDVILEPHGGEGDLAELIRQRYPKNKLLVIEKDPFCRKILRHKGFEVVWHDFLEWEVPVDVIFANPPFSRNYQDTDHFRHAYEVATRMAFIMHEYSGFTRLGSPNYKPRVFQNWLDQIGAQRVMNPKDSFLDGKFPSKVSTCSVWVDKDKT